MNRRGLKVTAVWAVLLMLAMTLLWQWGRIGHLTAEVAELRAQLAQTAPPSENRQLANVPPSSAPALAPEEFRELLRLRGEVGVLRRQLAEVVKPDSAPKVASKPAEVEPPAQPEARRKAALADSDAMLKAQEEKLEAGKQKVAGLVVALNIPQEVSNLDESATLGREDLKQYRSYFEARRELDEEERFAKILRMKVRFDHLDAGDRSGGGSSQ